MHPLAGQGLNLGMTDVAYLANCILKACKSGVDIGSFDFVLKEYGREAKLNTDLTVAAIEMSKRTYEPKLANSETLGHMLAHFRNFGANLIQTSDFVK